MSARIINGRSLMRCPVHGRKDVEAVGVVSMFRPKASHMMPTKAAMITTTTGARLTRKSPKSSPGGGADEDVGRVTDQCRGAADVRGKDLADQIRKRR